MPKRRREIFGDIEQARKEILALTRARKAGRKKENKHGVTSFDRKFQKRFGSMVYDSAVNRFGTAFVRRAADTWSKAQVLRKRAEIKRSRSKVRRYREAGLTKAQISRVARVISRQKFIPTYRYAPIRWGKNKGRYEKLDKSGRTVKVVSWREARSGYKRYRYERTIKDLSGGLGLPSRETRALYKDIGLAAKRDLAAFKKIDAYKRASRSRREGYTLARWKYGTVGALMRLFGIRGS